MNSIYVLIYNPLMPGKEVQYSSFWCLVTKESITRPILPHLLPHSLNFLGGREIIIIIVMMMIIIIIITEVIVMVIMPVALTAIIVVIEIKNFFSYKFQGLQ